MENLFCPYEQALALKELGFDEPCLAVYCESSGDELIFNEFEADWATLFRSPTFSQAFRWFRKKYGLDGWVVPYFSLDGKRYSYLILNEKIRSLEDELDVETYEEAELECLKKLIDIVKNNGIYNI